jgi:hypothetical protein
VTSAAITWPARASAPTANAARLVGDCAAPFRAKPLTLFSKTSLTKAAGIPNSRRLSISECVMPIERPLNLDGPTPGHA